MRIDLVGAVDGDIDLRVLVEGGEGDADFLGEIEVPIPESKKPLNEIALKVKAAEEARQAAIEGFGEALDRLNSQLGVA